MVSPAIAQAIHDAELSGDDQGSTYCDLLRNIEARATPESLTDDLKKIVDSVLSSESVLGVVATRSILDAFIATIQDLDSPDVPIAVCPHVLDLIAAYPTASSSLIEQASTIRVLLASSYEKAEHFLKAAQTLAGIPLDSQQRIVSQEYKARIWIRIVRNYLEIKDGTMAETYLNKVKTVIHQVTNTVLILHYKLSMARVQDSNRNFAMAAQSYHEISFSQSVVEEERLQTLSMAIKCAILAPAGPARNRMLGRLYRDERTAGLPEFGMLEKMFFDRLLTPTEVDAFSQGLEPHQLATTADGSTVLAKAVMEHNLFSASRLYRNISFDSLGQLLGLNAEVAEQATALMIEQGRLRGWIDQIESVVWFEGDQQLSGGKDSGPPEPIFGQEIRLWDSRIQNLAEEIEAVTSSIQAEFPDHARKYIAV